MYNENDILARLRAGETIEDIMDEMMAVVNSAVKAKDAEDEAKRKAEEAAAWQMKDADMLGEVLTDYLKKYCGSTDTITGEHIVAITPELTSLFKVAEKVQDSVNRVKATIKTPDGKVVTKTGKDAEDWAAQVFEDFFKVFNI